MAEYMNKASKISKLLESMNSVGLSIDEVKDSIVNRLAITNNINSEAIIDEINMQRYVISFKTSISLDRLLQLGPYDKIDDVYSDYHRVIDEDTGYHIISPDLGTNSIVMIIIFQNL